MLFSSGVQIPIKESKGDVIYMNPKHRQAGDEILLR